MPKRRDQIHMSEQEMWDFIESQKSLQVATLNRDGSPHLVTLWFAIVDGRIVMETFTKSQKVVNLERDPRIALLLEDGEVYQELRGVSINGTAELVKDVDAVHRLHVEVLKRNTPEIPVETLEQVSRGMAPKKTAIVVDTTKAMTWDHTKLGGIY